MLFNTLKPSCCSSAVGSIHLSVHVALVCLLHTDKRAIVFGDTCAACRVANAGNMAPEAHVGRACLSFAWY